MSAVVIRCEGIGKRYRMGERQRYRALRDTLTDALRAPFRRLRKAFGPKPTEDSREAEFFWALKNVSFEIRHGEVLGIIGRNGAGKSTLLKILSRITNPTVGRARIRGRAGALLEVGTGFHPELTGRENIYLNGAILGMTRREIERKFEEIVEFSECARFLDMPVKHYSSGMYMRLAFAVAAHLETEILFVDEVLAVGDVSFQKKCLGKIGDVAYQGRTVLFVSHNLLAVDSLCSRAICLHEGKIVMEGQARKVTSSYLQNWIPSSTEVTYEDKASAPGNDMLRLRHARIRPVRESAMGQITVRTPFVVEFEYWKMIDQGTLELGVKVFDEHGTLLFCTWWPGDRPVPAGLLRSWFVVPGDLLNTGTHRIHLEAYLGPMEVISLDDLLVFEVHDTDDLRHMYHEDWPGAVRPNLEWTTEQIAPPPGSAAARDPIFP